MNTNKEALLVLIKPDGLKKSLTGNILTKLSEAKLDIIGAKVVKVTEHLAEQHYYHLKEKPFFSELVKYLMGKQHGSQFERVLAFVYYGDNAIAKLRKISGATNPEEAEPTTIRGAYGRITTKGVYENVIHCSSATDESEREIKLWFGPDEIVYPIYPVKKAVKKDVEDTVWD